MSTNQPRPSLDDSFRHQPPPPPASGIGLPPIGPAAPGIAPVDLAPPTIYYVSLAACDDGQILANGIYGTAETARAASPKIARRRFVPLADDRRFRVVPIDESPRRPRGPVFTPRSVTVAYTMFFEDVDLFDRAAGLAEVARRNQAATAGGEGSWHVLLEIGRKLPVASGTIEIAENGVGAEERRDIHPVRVVRPTKAEWAQFEGVQ